MKLKSKDGYLIVVEGIDGSGKSTLAERLTESLRARGCSVVQTKEATDGPFGQRIRESLYGEPLSPSTELDLFTMDRYVHCQNVVWPALRRGSIVVQDRSYHSTMAYQGERGMDRAVIQDLSEDIAPTPDILLVVDVDAETAVRRIRAHRQTDHKEDPEVLERLRSFYFNLPGRIAVDGHSVPSAVCEAALFAVKRELQLKDPRNKKKPRGMIAPRLFVQAAPHLDYDNVDVFKEALVTAMVYGEFTYRSASDILLTSSGTVHRWARKSSAPQRLMRPRIVQKLINNFPEGVV